MPKLAPTASAFADPLTREVLQLIADYQRAARAAVAALGREINTTNPLHAWKQGRAERSGRLRQPIGCFEFHGAGCRFEISGRTVDVEFGPAGRHDGFDAWRLSQYARSAFEWQDLSPAQIEHALKALESGGVIVKPQWEPATELFYFSAEEPRGLG